MTRITAEELAQVNSFPRLVSLLRDKLEWPINEEYEFEDVIFEYEPHELGLKANETAKLREIHQLRPLVTGQPWGIFFLSFDDKTMSVTVLRRILRALVVKQRASGQSADRAAWLKEDLVFAANFGKSGERELAFVHFSDGASTGDLPVMKVLGWNARDTTLHNRYAADLLAKRLAWPDDTTDQSGWRNQWSSAFEVGHREVITTSKELAVRLAALAGDIRARANQLLAAETDNGPMRTMLEAFRKYLIHDLNEDGFADMFAQTICYGMLAARISRPLGIIADNLADMVPRTNPFLKELFASFLHLGGRDKRSGMDFDELGVRDVVEMLNRAKMEAVLRDFGDKNSKEDPVIHFYELFLKEYDPQKRMQRGVFYTPRPVVNFIVRGVDEILRTEFDLPMGLADTSTWAELVARNSTIMIPDHVKADDPFVQILDPATGTGTFLVEVIDLIHKRMVEYWQSEGEATANIVELWNEYVPAHLLPRLTAFELMMAPYSIAHMKVGLKLTETGYKFGSDERARIFLTNALEPAKDLSMEFDFMSEALAHEAMAANEAKDKVPFTVVIGNPPYSVLSQNNARWIQDIIASYREIGGVSLGERNSQSLQDDYVKFLSAGSSWVGDTGLGCIGMITPHGYLDNPTFRGMRYKLASTFNSLRFVDLHGNVNRRERTPDGGVDENVFEIMQGTAISFLTKAPSAADCRLAYAELWGVRDTKYEQLLAGRLEAIEFARPSFSPDQYLFVSRDDSFLGEYSSLPSITAIFPYWKNGFMTSRDAFVLDFDSATLKDRISAFVQTNDLKAFSERHRLKDVRERTLVQSQTEVRALSRLQDRVRTVRYRPFDDRHAFYDNSLVRWPVADMAAQFETGNLALVTSRMTKGENFQHAMVSNNPVEKISLSSKTSNNAYVFVLWDNNIGFASGRRPNIDGAYARSQASSIGLCYSDGIRREEKPSMGADYPHQTGEKIGLLDRAWNGRGDLEKDIGPRDLFDYIYAVLHAPGYRNRYAEFLKSEFPRIPTPATLALFAALVPLGRDLVALHLLKPDEAPLLKTPEIRLVGNGSARVEKGFPQYANGKVMINASRWFEDVPKATWEFHVGGYQPCEKWLKDRAAKGGKKPSEGRVLTDDDILHYRRMVTALTETRRIMAEIDTVIETHGGWPGAFAVAMAAEAEPA